MLKAVAVVNPAEMVIQAEAVLQAEVEIPIQAVRDRVADMAVHLPMLITREVRQPLMVVQMSIQAVYIQMLAALIPMSENPT